MAAEIVVKLSVPMLREKLASKLANGLDNTVALTRDELMDVLDALAYLIGQGDLKIPTTREIF